ncbi:unnamed protein product [Cyprideis torosa]|uniref:Uncharacterized protein n=1 Tax=Cyprideis torosa TaxID=163714 RepID=A0A7R8ZRA5_9CRUS|nr:unnamed protein product [Cyprideis torosa]CAG0904698.1 unnamed protein product [Cyprideis torosa]
MARTKQHPGYELCIPLMEEAIVETQPRSFSPKALLLTPDDRHFVTGRNADVPLDQDGCLSGVCNGCAIAIIWSKKKKLTPTIALNTSIYVANLIVAIIAFLSPGYYVSSLSPIYDADNPCLSQKWLNGIFGVAVSTKILSFLGLQAERFRSVRLLENQTASWKETVGICIFIWGVSITYYVSLYAPLEFRELRVDWEKPAMNTLVKSIVLTLPSNVTFTKPTITNDTVRHRLGSLVQLGNGIRFPPSQA